MKAKPRETPDPAFHYRAFDASKVAELEGKGWVRCTPEETRAYWLMLLGETLEAAGLVALKKAKR